LIDFKETINDELLEKKNIILLFNKFDLFKIKIKEEPLSKYFNDFKGNNFFFNHK
jgi:hypothetical protein